MSHESDAVAAICAALGKCFAGYDDRRLVSTSVCYPMDDVAIVKFSIVARGIEVYGSVSIITDVADWSGACFVSDFSPASKRWLKHGPTAVSVPEFARELVAVCAAGPDFALTHPPIGRVRGGFRFDLPEAC